MSEPFLGQLATFGFNFAPTGWATCQGQVLPISQYSALFALLGTNYGGNGTSNFQLPNLQGCVAVGQGSLPGGSTYEIGEIGGLNTVTLTSGQMPLHSHALNGTTGEAGVATPGGNTLATPVKGAGREAVRGSIYNTVAPNLGLAAKTIGQSGTNTPLPHNNVQPYLAITYCIALTGKFPPRN